MSALRNTVVRQFSKPSGPLGHVAGWIMAARGSNRARSEWAVNLVAPRPGEELLEIGCGPGHALAFASTRAQGLKLTGIDHSAVMIGQATKRLRREAVGTEWSLFEGDLALLRQWPGRFDAIWWVNVVQFLPDMAAALARLRAALKPGGRLVTVYQPRHAHPTRADAERKAADVERAMRALGFGGVRAEILELKPVAAVAVVGLKP